MCGSIFFLNFCIIFIGHGIMKENVSENRVSRKFGKTAKIPIFAVFLYQYATKSLKFGLHLWFSCTRKPVSSMLKSSDKYLLETRPFLAVFRRFGLVKTTKSNKTKTFLLVDQYSHIAVYFDDLNKRNNF